jgi:uncharacterized protein (TIGR00369 family)
MTQLLDGCEQISGFEQLRQIMAQNEQDGLAGTLDIRLVEIEAGRVVVESNPGLHVYNPIGSVHGGFIASMLDYACGYSVMSRQGAGQSFTTLELKVSYHKAIRHNTGPVRAEGRILSIGRRVAFTEAKLTDAAGKLYASATSSLLLCSS